MFKVLKGLGPVIFAEAFPVRQQSQYNMTNSSYFAMPLAKTVKHGLESLSFIGSKLWDSIPSNMKEINSINEFKHAIKTWKSDLYSCRLCKVYVQNIEYLWSAFFLVRLTLYISFPCLVICWNLWSFFEI